MLKMHGPNTSANDGLRGMGWRALAMTAVLGGAVVVGGCGGGGGGGGGNGDGGTPSFTVSTSSGAGGSISPASASVTQGSTASFTVTPLASHDLVGVTGCGGTRSGNTYTTGVITTACTVTATFELKSFTVTANAGAGGSISPGSAAVDYGATAQFNVSVDTGFEIATVSGCGGSRSGQAYTTGPITGDCAIEVTFLADLTAPTGLSASGGDGFVTVTWTAVSGATGYNVYWSQTPDINRDTAASYDDIDIAATSPHVVAGLTNGTTYYFAVTATRNSEESEISAEVSATPSAAPAGGGELRTNRFLIDVGGARAEPLHVAAVSAFVVEEDEILFLTRGFQRQLWRHDMKAGRLEFVAEAGDQPPHGRHALALGSEGEIFAFVDDGENISTSLIAIDLETGASRPLQNEDLRTFPRGDLAITANGDLVVTSLTGAVLLMDKQGTTLADPEKPLGVHEVRALTRAPSGAIIAAAVTSVASTGTLLLEVDPQTAALTPIGTFPTVGSGLNSERRIAATADAYYVGALGVARTLHRIDKTTFDVTEIELNEDIRLEMITSSLRTGDDGGLYVRLEDRRAVPDGAPVVVRLDSDTHEPEIALGGASSVSDTSGGGGIKLGALGPDNDLLLPYFAGTGAAVPDYARIFRHVRRTGALKLVTSETVDNAVLVDPRQIALSGNDVYVLDRRPAEYLVHVDLVSGIQTEITNLGTTPTGSVWSVKAMALNPVTGDLILANQNGQTAQAGCCGSITRLTPQPGAALETLAMAGFIGNPRDLKVSASGEIYFLGAQNPNQGIYHLDPDTGVQSEITEAPTGTTIASFDVLDEGTIVVLGWTDSPSSPKIWVVDAAGELEEILSHEGQVGGLLMRLR